MSNLITLFIVSMSVGLGNFAASVAIGLSGVNKSLRIKIAIIFGLFETLMPIVGLVIGHQLANLIGDKSSIIGGILLILTGLYIVKEALFKTDEAEVKVAAGNMKNLLIAGLALSIDNLIVGFGLGAYHVSLIVAAVMIGVTSITLSLIGLELGKHLSSKVEEYSELLSGLILILIGIAIGLHVI
ncbi:MAG TPA: manganese efflux pump [Candidatus Saccharimonadales bacterium]|nr:manganese efflux pump [Candidatus Saccharimonadales bacterium]